MHYTTYHIILMHANESNVKEVCNQVTEMAGHFLTAFKFTVCKTSFSPPRMCQIWNEFLLWEKLPNSKRFFGGGMWGGGWQMEQFSVWYACLCFSYVLCLNLERLCIIHIHMEVWYKLRHVWVCSPCGANSIYKLIRCLYALNITHILHMSFPFARKNQGCQKEVWCAKRGCSCF